MAFRKVKFKIDPIEEAKVIPKILETSGERLIAEPYRKEILSLSGNSLLNYIKSVHEQKRDELAQKLRETKSLWGEIEQDYYKIFCEHTNSRPSLERDCYLSPLILGYADTESQKKVFINSGVQQDWLNYLVPHEITHLLYRDVIKELEKPHGMTSPLMEGIAHLIVFKTPIQDLVKTSLKYSNIGFIKRNPKFMKRMSQTWSRKKDFPTFLEKAIKLADEIKPTNY